MKNGFEAFGKLTTVTVAGPPDLNAFDAERAQLPVHPYALTKTQPRWPDQVSRQF